MRSAAATARPAAVSPPAGAAPPRPVQYVRLPGTDVDIVLPGRGNPAARFRAYATGVAAAGAFANRDAELAQLRALTATAVTPKPNVPRVGVLLAEPEELLRGDSSVQRPIAEIVAGIRMLGCEPVLIPPLVDVLFDGASRDESIDALLSGLDGLVGPGGQDLHPRLYGEDVTHSLPGAYERDKLHADILERALDHGGLYFFGICRSHQLVNAVRGARIVQDMMLEGFASHTHSQNQVTPKIPAQQLFRAPATDGGFDMHSIRFSGELAAATGVAAARTNAYHHQVPATAGDGLEVVGTFHDEGTGKDLVEATAAWNVLSVQFHPESRLDHPVERRMWSTLNRSWLFRAAKDLRAAGVDVSADAILERARAQGGSISKLDERWLRTELLPRLA